MASYVASHSCTFSTMCNIFLTLFLSSCKQSSKQQATEKNIYYTCSMHPQVMLDHPGKCPICGMTLIAVSKNNTSASNEIHLNERQIELGNIHTDTIHTGSFGNKMILAGTLNFNQQTLVAISARAEGRIETLYFKNIGDYVHKGDKLYEIYSEELNNEKQEYVSALQQNGIDNTLINYSSLVDAAKTKLLLRGMTNEQIKQLAKTKEVATTTTFYSSEDGYITTLNIKEGDYVMDGGSIMELANLSTLWAEAQVYSSQLSMFDINGTATIQIPDLNDLQINTHIDFVNPEINPDTRINLVRATIPMQINNYILECLCIYCLIIINIQLFHYQQMLYCAMKKVLLCGSKQSPEFILFGWLQREQTMVILLK
ncbi:MAG: efflux RND transporter periplasmic adaptor subunit [Ferruginibacter sp.]